MEYLMQFGTVVVLTFFIACLELMFQYFMQPNMILYPYSVLLSKIASKGEVWRHLMRPLGRCRFCNAIWITFYAYQHFYKLDLTVLLAFGLTTLFVQLLTKYVFKDVDPATKTDDERGVSYVIDVIYDENGKKTEIIKNTPWQSMLISYLILGAFYAIVYLLIPYIINL